MPNVSFVPASSFVGFISSGSVYVDASAKGIEIVVVGLFIFGDMFVILGSISNVDAVVVFCSFVSFLAV